MAEVKWIKITTDMFDNRKIKHLRKMPEGNNIVLIWVMLLTMAGRCNASGMIFLTENIPYTTKMLADELDFDENTIILALKVLSEFGMIVFDENSFSISNWEEHQNIDGMERIREQNRIRKQRQREREKDKLLALENKNVTCHVTSHQNHATDIDIELDIDINNNEEENIYNNAHERALETLINTFEVELKRPLTPIEFQFLYFLRNDYSEELITLALSEAVMNNARSFKYIERILINWRGAGITTVDEARKYIDSFNKRKSKSNNELDDIKREYKILVNNAETLEASVGLRNKYFELTGRDIEDDIYD